MTIDDAFELIKKAEISRNDDRQNWADLGCGNGIFTHALAQILPAESAVCGIDKVKLLQPGFAGNGVEITARQLDFMNDDLELQNLDGILMANALHYVKDKPALIQKMKTWIKPGGSFLMVEYDTDTPVARWIPYPASFSSLSTLFKNAGYQQIKQLGERPSVYRRANMYSAWISK